MGKVKLDDTIRAAIHNMLTARPKPKIPTRHLLHASSPRQKKAGLWARPFESDALGVNPDQIPQAAEALRKAGLAVDFNEKTGAAIITSDKQYRDVAKAVGIFNGRDGYGIPNENGDHMPTGREPVRLREEFRRRMLSNEED
jgi:hypothetical protein